MEVLPGSQENQNEEDSSVSPQVPINIRQEGLSESMMQKEQDKILIHMPNQNKKSNNVNAGGKSIQNPILELNPNLKNKEEVKSSLAALMAKDRENLQAILN